MLFVFNCGGIGLFGQETIKGKIGKYPIEVVITDSDSETGELEGKYRYASKKEYLELKGEVSGAIVTLTEYYNDKSTGNFYLERKENELVGKWIAGNKWYPVVLYLTPTTLQKFAYKTLAERGAKASPKIGGTYSDENYYINDWFFKEDKPELELGFSGGTATFEQLHPDSLRFLVQVVCGPTYHIAYAAGVAVKKSEQSYYCLLEAYEGDTCEVQIEFSEKLARVKAIGTNHYVCGFGARAYLDHEFTKISDETDFSEDY